MHNSQRADTNGVLLSESQIKKKSKFSPLCTQSITSFYTFSPNNLLLATVTYFLVVQLLYPNRKPTHNHCSLAVALVHHVFNWCCIFSSAIPWLFLSCTSSSHNMTGSLHGPHLISWIDYRYSSLLSSCSHVLYYTMDKTAITFIFQAYPEHSFNPSRSVQKKARAQVPRSSVPFRSGLWCIFTWWG